MISLHRTLTNLVLRIMLQIIVEYLQAIDKNIMHQSDYVDID